MKIVSDVEEWELARDQRSALSKDAHYLFMTKIVLDSTKRSLALQVLRDICEINGVQVYGDLNCENIVMYIMPSLGMREAMDCLTLISRDDSKSKLDLSIRVASQKLRKSKL